uniref:Uncharacterized protein n=1 Tax=Romanomermis culicivorax TaxID=13658 RepID=A0A915K0L1_ROMCU
MNECATNTHDCDKKAVCTDTDEGYICQCPDGFLDDSLDPQKPGRRCRLISFSTDVCEKNNCSSDALCIPIAGGYACQCKPGFVDFSPNRQRSSGLVCKKKENECINGKATCHKDATCLDTDESYICVCKPGFIDKLGLTNPGRSCEPFNLNEKCSKGNNDCDPNARCIPQGANDYVCLCPPGYKDKSPNIQSRPVIPECDNPSLNDCDENAHCFEQEDGFTCACKADYVDISRDQNKPGRLCKKLVDECFHKMDDCALDTDGGICEDTADSYACRCRPGYADLSPDPINRPGRVCRPIRNKCSEGLHDCSPNAHCVEMGDSFTCKCGPGFFDVSTDPVNRPGRMINECETGNLNDCSPNAFCNDTIQSYICQCKSGFNDESPDLLNRPGRICRPRNVDECELNTADCSVNADCIDLDDGFRCQCRQGFIDESPSKITLPGRVCVASKILNSFDTQKTSIWRFFVVPAPPTTPKPECRLEDINSCNVNLNEVCRMAQGQPKCVCPERFERNPQTNACSVVDECKFFELNDCAQNAVCVDELDGYTCKCKPNFKDKSPSPSRPGRVCQPMINECQFPHLNDCHQNALCTDLENGYQCKCKDGFLDMSPDPVNRPGRICHFNVDECQNSNLNSCDQNAKCVDEPFGYHCECNTGFLDISPTPTIPGRACKKIVDECLNKRDNDCDPIAKCIDTRESYRCECPANSTDISPNPAFTGRVCHIDVDVCRENLHDCDKNAICRNKGSSFVCECVQNFIDRSPNPLRPGRVCIPLVNECQEGSATCSPNAECRDLEDGYTCTCKQGFVDRSPVKTQPGRVCTRPEICPSNHDCSSAAICEPNDNGGYSCRCIPGYEDQSPSDKAGRVCVRGDKCRDARLNNCSQNAVCYSLVQGYRCECVQGFVDKSPNPALPGRVCEPQKKVDVPKKHPCQDPSLNDCALAGVCRSLNENNYTCECRPGYSDRSPDPQKSPGRVCVPQPPICFDPSQNDCHPFAICEQLDDARRFSCRCRDGYVDTSPDPQKPGRICREKINECLDASKNDCAPQAVCEDLDLGFKCRCPPKFKDVSPDPQRPGRKCAQLIDECQNPQMNNCSRFADCIDQENGYRCQCKDGYFDNDRSLPGRQCAFIINECEFPNLNDCDKHALCTDLPGGYSCRCPDPYTDGSPDPSRFPGRICLLNECLEQRTNDCHPDSICQDTPDSYVCHCKEGFVDNSPDPRKPGRFCSKPNPDAIPCGRSLICLISLNERCVGGVRCECPPLTSRRASGQPCVPVVGFQLPLRVVRREQTPLNWASAFGNPNDPRYIEITDMFDFGLAQSINATSVAPAFISASTDAITHPRLYNASWNDGLMFNFTVYFQPNTVDNPEKVWKELMKSISSNQYEIGDSTLFIDAYQMDPFAPPPNPEPTCGSTGKSCDLGLGEVCLAGRVCACPNGKGRRELKNPCVEIVGFTLPLWVIRRNHETFTYNKSFVDTNSPFYKNLVDTFGKGCQQAYSKTSLWNGYVSNEVRDILDPRKFNGSWDHGCVFNFTVYFEKAAQLDARRCYNELVKSCQSTNYSLGGTELYINHLQQPSPFSPCFKNDCHPSSTCIERGSNSYTCTCPAKFRDLDANHPGRRCIAEDEFDECANPSDNECSPNANCIDEPHLYRCECKSGYIDMSPHDQGKGRICDLDYCLDVPFCPANTSCQNVPEIQGARCQCHPGYTDVKPSSKRLRLFGENVFCLATRDVNECDLELTNCSSVAVCTDTADGYRCACPPGYTDANPSLPGRVCAGASCGLCNGHGDCLPVAGSPEVKCRYKGGE